jgi:hypothetical protein
MNQAPTRGVHSADGGRVTVRIDHLPSARVERTAAMSSHRAWIVSVFLAVFSALLISLGRVLLPDTYISLTAGRLISEQGLPHHDTLTVAGRGQSWIDQQWLAHWLFFQSWQLGGYALVGALSAALIATAFVLLFALVIGRGAPPIRALAWCGAAFLVVQRNSETRAQSFAYPLFVAVLALILADAKRDRWNRQVLVALPLLAVWGNVHGSVLLGCAMIVSYLAARAVIHAKARRIGDAARYAATATLAMAASVITPYGATILSYYPSVLENPNLRSIAEWQSPSFAGIDRPFIFLLLVTIALTGIAHGRGRRPPLALIAITACLGLLATQAVRYEVWFALAAVVLISDCLTASSESSPTVATAQTRQLSRILLASCVLLAGFSIAKALTTNDGHFERMTPPSSLQVAHRYAMTSDTKILTDDTTGSAMLWLYPSLSGRVAFDARDEIYPPDKFQTLARFIVLARNWRSALAGYDEISVSCYGHSDLCTAIRGLTGWRIIFSSAGALTAVRTTRTT